METSTEQRQPAWARTWLRAAALYNVLWGAAVVLFPNLLFTLCGMAPPNYPEIWQCVGMIVGVYGLGYWIAAGDSRRHWPIVLVGFLGKAFGPIGFAMSIAKGSLPPAFALTTVTNDLIWLLPFALILKDAYKSERSKSS